MDSSGAGGAEVGGMREASGVLVTGWIVVGRGRGVDDGSEARTDNRCHAEVRRRISARPLQRLGLSAGEKALKHEGQILHSLSLDQDDSIVCSTTKRN